MKPIVVRTYAAFLEYAKVLAANKRNTYLQEDRLLSLFKRDVKFVIKAVISCGIDAGSYFHRDGIGNKWLTENATGKWYVEYAAINWAWARVYFEDEGDAFRFAWVHEEIPD
jgi:hypothetical protein